ncbi:MAG: acylphosphatase, partial [Candidatus Methanofastidiosa archaeon]|nr:acylphosphatase [Candidatus Methanofastidiosa archaeon]
MSMLVLRIYGIVQGVGFRPFVWRIAHRTGVKGSVKNKGGYVEVALQGRGSDIARFKDLLSRELPCNAFIDFVEEEEAPDGAYDGFSIVPSEETGSRLPSGIP